jgi:branched-subunit amino acid aminotransferase/4-amino-4-deoxychorismate lyase
MADTLIETVRIMDGEAPLWPLHHWRLMNSALMVGIALPEIAIPDGGDDRVVRIEVGEDKVEITEREVEGGDTLALASSPAPHRGYPHKIGARAWLEAAHTTSRITGADDALLFDAEGRLVEATRWAIGWWEGETLFFPPFSLGGLKSVARARITEMARGGVREAVLRRDEIAKRSFVACNAARGIVSVAMLDGTPLAENPRTAALAKRFWVRPTA